MIRMIGGTTALFMLTAATPPPAERSAEGIVSGDALIAVTIDGKPLRFRIEPSVPGVPLVAPALAPVLGLKPGGLLGLGVCYRIGRERACGGTKMVRFAREGGKPDKRRVGWMTRPYKTPVDGTIGPGDLPEPVVRFALRPPRGGERTVILPMEGGTGLFGGWSTIVATMTVGGVPIRLRFDPYRPRSLATAAAAVPIAAAGAGVMTAETGRQEIMFGIVRPYRVMRLGRPLAIGGLSLTDIGVRVADGDIAGRIVEEGAAADAVDPDEVVVTARRGKPRPGALILGADALAGCSSIVFDKPARTISVTCGG